MIAVIFEVEPHAAQKSTYFDMAADLKPLLEEVDGFISVERFESLMNPGKILSLSFWRDEQAIQTWRRLEKHRQAQSAGRSAMFRDYRLRIAEVMRDYGMADREQAPDDSKSVHREPSD